MTAFNPKSLVLVDGEIFENLEKFPYKLNILHGLATYGDGIRRADRAEKTIVKFDKKTDREIDQIRLPEDDLDLHGLTIRDQEL